MAQENSSTHQGIEARRQYVRLTIALVILCGILGSFIIYLAWPLLTGTTVVLATQPIDPFDPLRGQYMTIRYEISTILSIPGASVGDTVYVSLHEDDSKIWRYQSASLSRPQDGIYIKGTIDDVDDKTMNLNYGIEQYFFERGASIPTQNITVEAKLSSNGGARITHLLENGKPIKIKYAEKNWLS